jgi:hypothetical protein
VPARAAAENRHAAIRGTTLAVVAVGVQVAGVAAVVFASVGWHAVPVVALLVAIWYPVPAPATGVFVGDILGVSRSLHRLLTAGLVDLIL